MFQVDASAGEARLNTLYLNLQHILQCSNARIAALEIDAVQL